MARPVWTGSISFGLVNVPVKAYTAVTGSLIFVVVLATGAVVGAVVAGVVAIAREAMRGRHDDAGDGVHALSGPEAT